MPLQEGETGVGQMEMLRLYHSSWRLPDGLYNRSCVVRTASDCGFAGRPREARCGRCALVAIASCDGAEIMVAPYRGGHAIGAVSWPHSAPSSDLSAASQVPAVRQTSDAYDPEPMASSSSIRHHRRALSRPGLYDTKPVVPF